MNESQKSADLLRKELSSITLEDLKVAEEPVSDADASNRASDTELFYRNWFRRVLLNFLRIQAEEIAKTAVNDSMTQFGRGTFNGIKIIKEWCEKQVNISLSRFDKKESEEI